MDPGPKTKSLKFFKILGIIFGLGLSMLIIVLGVIFYNLPSAQQLGSYFKKEKTVKTKIAEEKLEQVTVSTDQTAAVLSDQPINDYKDTSNLKQIDHAQELEKLKEFLDDKTPAISFCGKLNFARTGPIEGLNPSNLKNEKSGTSRGEIDPDDLSRSDDLRLEAIKPFFKTVLKQPQMLKLITMVISDEEFRNGSNVDQAGLFDKALFYKQAYSAFSEMKQNLPNYESIVDRSYLMYKLNDLIAFKPDLQNDPRITKFCEESEQQFNIQAPVEFDKEKQVFERLVQELGVDPQAIGYDPHYKTKLDLDFSGNNLQISGGWLNELMPPEAAAKKN